ncbi:MAG: sigma-54-dependent Fis family transcriptional regulator [Devosia sp.]|uniref:sigma-54-dependent transcriptional regulator n=1 Tax=Devosia sp. TaxID=1871048 RepID=UPI001A0E1E43|nr:sigma-54 dependent transcriptional regulator [Devosia sp.]MBF0680135.1 sigma-54-dependent Fis family transcriptional regulator [Devosia sp.]
MTRGRIAFIDDEAQLCEAAAEWLGVSGFDVKTFTDPVKAMQAINGNAFDCVVTDMRMPGASGQDVLRHFSGTDSDMPVVLLTGHGDVGMAVDAMRGGAHDFIEKPYDADHLIAVLDRAVERRRMGEELRKLREATGAELDTRLVGISAPMVQLRRSIAQLADIDVDILLNGETGVGKEVVARALHDFGHRSKGPFIAINCAAVPESVFESELFGHEKGAFTGAAGNRIGKLEFARGGTVFLDEIESMPLALQAKVLRAIQERSVEPLGSNIPRDLDVRFIAATKVDLKAEIDAGRFRADLYFRLATVELAIPPLRDRREDIPLLHALFAGSAAQRFNMSLPIMPQSLLQSLLAGSWPGNVRELKAVAERFVLGLGNTKIATEKQGSLTERVAQFEAETIAEALRECGGSSAEAAVRLAVPRRTLNEKIAKYGLRAETSGNPPEVLG